MPSDFDDTPLADNLISVKTDLSQQQTAGWTPGAAVMTGLGCAIQVSYVEVERRVG